MLDKIAFKEKLKKIILGYSHFTPSFSQAGEDMILRSIFMKYYNGTYVDVGAYHPYIGSNTHYFYRFMNWRGINIEPNPRQMDYFMKYRKQDINLNIGISTERSVMEYYVIKDIPVMNSFSLEFLKRAGLEETIEKKMMIQTLPLAEVLKTHLPQNKSIDILNIDAEGMDQTILESNDWDLYRPKCIIIESDVDNWENSPARNYLKERDYTLAALTPVNLKVNISGVYLENSFLKTYSNY